MHTSFGEGEKKTSEMLQFFAFFKYIVWRGFLFYLFFLLEKLHVWDP